MEEKLDFDHAVQKLEAIVHELESGNLSLEKALTAFEEGIGLINFCNQQIESAEKKIEVLTESGGKKKLVPYEEQNQNIF
ncbi:MAG: exodeoxyribonuclease VII small subunit [Candidatus Schekmanbacteria bacterium]|nr:exodeoxyribonuclease VII small subunit [Candidatus Schekmanbacteria bacterium]